MNNAQRLKILTNSAKTVFSSQDLQTLWKSSSKTTKITAKRMVDKNLIIRPAKGYYALNDDFNIYELANLIISPSYVSFNSALFYHHVCFQLDSTVSSVARLNYEKKIKDLKFKYYAMKEPLLLNLAGIDYKNNLAMARPERAILDSCYFGLLPNIDNVNKINISYLQKLSSNYPKTVQKKIKKLIKK